MISDLKPNFFIIGAPKCGTTALTHYLSEHPSIFFSKPKEPFFWDTDHANCRKTVFLPTESDYLKLFASANPKQHIVLAEGSTTYLQSHVAIENILRFNPDARFLVMLRNPVDVAHGMHGQLLRHFLEDVTDFEAAWRLQQERANGNLLPRNPRFPHQLQYQEVASFAPQLDRLFKLVPETRRKIIVFDDFVKDTALEYQATLDFLGLSHDGRTEFPKVNEARKYRLGWMGRLYHDPPAPIEVPMRWIRSHIMQLSGPMKERVTNLVAKKEPRTSISPDFRAELHNVFRDDVIRTSELIQKDLSYWLKPENETARKSNSTVQRSEA